MEQETLDKINALTRREFKAEELYTFPVVLCGNEIDRDFERFSDDALEQMAPLFIGKTIISDHDMKAENQVARLYDVQVISAPEALTKDGRPYKYLKGFAYTVYTEKNADLITEIDAGIKKEVSVSCASARRICSVCGASVLDAPCGHQRGQMYDGKLCHYIIDGVTDAYELSFTPVPAQPDAGVTKSYHEKGGITMEQDFTPITTKADFDAAVQEAVNAAVAAKAAEFEGFISPEEHQQALDAIRNEQKSALRKAYCEKAALMTGLPDTLASRLTGDTEEDILKDAQMLSAATKSGFATPHFDVSGTPMDGVEKAFFEKNPDLKK